MAIKKIGLAGLGHIGRRHLSQLKSLDIDVVSADPKVSTEEAHRLGAHIHYTDFTNMLQSEHPEAVSICLPSFMHRHSTIEALRCGAHILVEKPFALSLQDIDDMMKTAEECDRRIMVAHVCRFMGQNIKARELVDGKTLGNPVQYSAWRMSPTPLWSDKNWLGNQKASGGTVMDLQIHDIDLACWLLGEPSGVALMQRQSPSKAGSGFFHSTSFINFPGCASATLEAGHLMPEGYIFTNGFRLIFDQGVLQCESTGHNLTLKLFEVGKLTDYTGWYTDNFAERNPYRDEIVHFLHCLDTGEKFTVTTEEARRAVEVVLKLQESRILI